MKIIMFEENLFVVEKIKIQVLRGEISKLERSRSNPSLKLRGLTQVRKKYFVKKGLYVVSK